MPVVRFATFNIGSARGADGQVELARFTDAIASLDADVLALQEVDRSQPRSHGADLTRLAAEALHADHVTFAPALYGTPGSRWDRAGDEPRDGPAYGCSLISRVPLADVRVIHMPAAPVVIPLWVPGPGVVLVREEPRVAVVARVEPGSGIAMTVVATHLPFVPGWKQWQLRRLIRTLADVPDPVLLLGDLNLRRAAASRVTGYRVLASAPTFPAPRPRLQLDHVLLRGPLPGAGRVTAVSTPAVAVSDHRPLVVDITFGSGG